MSVLRANAPSAKFLANEGFEFRGLPISGRLNLRRQLSGRNYQAETYRPYHP